MSHATQIEKLAAKLSSEIYEVDLQTRAGDTSFEQIIINGNVVCALSWHNDLIPKKTCLMVTFQGTNSGTDILRDIQPGKKAIPNFGGRARAGFYQSARKTWRPVRQYIREHRPESVVFTGHSYGGAMCQVQAALAMVTFEYLQNTLYCVSIASPRVFDRDAAQIFNDHFHGRNTRVVASGDPVPRVPTMALFRHVEGRLLIEKGTAYRDELKNPVKAWANNTWHLFKGTVTLAKHHSASDYARAIDKLPLVAEDDVVSPSDSYVVIT